MAALLPHVVKGGMEVIASFSLATMHASRWATKLVRSSAAKDCSGVLIGGENVRPVIARQPWRPSDALSAHRYQGRRPQLHLEHSPAPTCLREKVLLKSRGSCVAFRRRLTGRQSEGRIQALLSEDQKKAPELIS